jgi:hypothetical protein
MLKRLVHFVLCSLRAKAEYGDITVHWLSPLLDPATLRALCAVVVREDGRVRTMEELGVAQGLILYRHATRGESC